MHTLFSPYGEALRYTVVRECVRMWRETSNNANLNIATHIKETDEAVNAGTLPVNWLLLKSTNLNRHSQMETRHWC